MHSPMMVSALVSAIPENMKLIEMWLVTYQMKENINRNVSK